MTNEKVSHPSAGTCFAPRLLVVVDVDGGVLPLAGGDVTVEENVDLSVGAVLHLGQPDVRRRQTDKSRGGPDVTGPAGQVGTLGVEHPGGQVDAGDVDNVVRGTTDAGGERPEADGRRLSDDDPRGRGGTQAEQHRDDQTKRGGRQG